MVLNMTIYDIYVVLRIALHFIDRNQQQQRSVTRTFLPLRISFDSIPLYVMHIIYWIFTLQWRASYATQVGDALRDHRLEERTPHMTHRCAQARPNVNDLHQKQLRAT